MHNLMARHQDGSGDSGAAQFVQPRPRARFEADSAPSFFTDSSNNFSESGSFSQNKVAPSFANSPKRISKLSVFQSDPPVSPVQSFHQENSPTDRRTAVQPEPHLTDSHQNTATAPPFAEWNRRMENILHRLRTPQQQTQSDERNFHADEAVKRLPAQPQIQVVEQRAERSGGHVESVSLRIEEILHRLHVRPKEQAVMSTFSERITVIEQERLPHPPEAKSVLQTENKPERQISRSASSPLSSRSAGLLELPGWLNGLQAELQNLREGASAAPQAQPERVINVTIGRVEVRAVQATTAQRAQRSLKPSGIMSLDEYLKQRENRG